MIPSNRTDVNQSSFWSWPVPKRTNSAIEEFRGSLILATQVNITISTRKKFEGWIRRRAIERNGPKENFQLEVTGWSDIGAGQAQNLVEPRSLIQLASKWFGWYGLTEFEGGNKLQISWEKDQEGHSSISGGEEVYHNQWYQNRRQDQVKWEQLWNLRTIIIIVRQ